MTNTNYENTIIYKIVCKNEDVKDVYVGSTTRFNKRRTEHKKRCNNNIYKEYNHKIYQIIRANGGWDNFEMVEIIKQPCNDRAHAHALERYYCELLNSNMNTVLPGRDKEKKKIYQNEYYVKNKEKLKLYQHEYKQKKKEHKKELQKIYHETFKQKKILNYESNITRDETLKQILNIEKLNIK
jgi:hypothetical protein